MAYVQNDEDEEQQSGGQPQQGAERVLTPESGTVNAGPGSGGAQAAGAGGQNQKKASGTGWTNLQRYVDANQGADERMGGQIRGALDKSASEVKANEDAYGADVRQNVQTARRDDAGTIASLKSNPTAVKKDDYQRQTSAWDGYTAANQGQGFSQAEQGVQKQAQRAGNLNDFSKRQAEMADIYGKGEDGSPVRYTGGEQRLDTFLIGAGQGGQKALADINTEYGQGGNFAKGWEGLVQKAQGDIDAGQAARQATADATRAAQAEAVAARDAKFKELEAQLAKEKTFAQQSTDSARAAARGGEQAFVNELLRKAGKDPNDFYSKKITGDELASFIKMNGQRGLGDLASDEDVAAYQALLDLEGQSYDPNRFAKTGNQGGTYTFDSSGLAALVDKKKADIAAEAAANAAKTGANDYKGAIGERIPESSREPTPAPSSTLGKHEDNVVEKAGGEVSKGYQSARKKLGL